MRRKGAETFCVRRNSNLCDVNSTERRNDNVSLFLLLRNSFLKESTVWKLTLNSLALLLRLRQTEEDNYTNEEETTRVQRFTPVPGR